MTKKEKPADQKGQPRRIANKRARFDYHILEVVECGLALLGTEAKSLRAGNASLEGAYATIRGGQAYLVGCNIATYSHAAGDLQHDPLRDRKLLLHRRQLHELQSLLDQKGRTLVPLAIYFKNGWAKCEIGAAVGKKDYDKRRAIQDRQQRREIDRQIRRPRRGEG
jgi:SsrA-binding protein